jgi:excisionase family DNA binding protein
MKTLHKKEEAVVDRLIGVNELAEYLGVPVSWCYSRTRLKGPERIPFIRVGKYLKFVRQDVLDWLQRQQEGVGV